MVVALVTGGNTGIGEAVAHQLAKQPDHHVIISARNPEAGAKVVAELVAAGHSASSVQLDLTFDESIANAVHQIQNAHGRLDILVNNAGGDVDQVPGLSAREIFAKNFDVNVSGPAILTDALLPLLNQSSAPRVVFVSSSLASISMSCDKTSPLYSLHREPRSYTCSKAALNRLVGSYSRALSDAGGLVNAVCPGYVKTKLTSYAEGGRTPEQGAKRIVEMALLGEGGPTGTFSDDQGPVPW